VFGFVDPSCCRWLLVRGEPTCRRTMPNPCTAAPAAQTCPSTPRTMPLIPTAHTIPFSCEFSHFSLCSSLPICMGSNCCWYLDLVWRSQPWCVVDFSFSSRSLQVMFCYENPKLGSPSPPVLWARRSEFGSSDHDHKFLFPNKLDHHWTPGKSWTMSWEPMLHYKGSFWSDLWAATEFICISIP